MHVSEMTFLRDHWYAVAKVEDMANGAPRPVRLFGQEYVLWAPAGGDAVVTQPYCPHRGAHLSAAGVRGDRLICRYHGWEYTPSGACAHIPQLEPSTPIPPKAKLDTWPVVVRYGLLWTCVGTPTEPGPPAWFEADQLGWRVQVDFFEPWAVSALRVVDNNIDQSHPAFVHQGTFGDPSQPQVPRYQVEPTAAGFKANIIHEVKGVGPQMSSCSGPWPLASFWPTGVRHRTTASTDQPRPSTTTTPCMCAARPWQAMKRISPTTCSAPLAGE
jgi:phenylpropionate dioxygenase-like ring-hydroxylating dioxygenase large terminal subunit